MQSHKLVIFMITILLISTFFILGFESRGFKKEVPKKAVLQEYLSGLGLGGVVRPSWGYLNYDPRIDFWDETILWPLPGGYSYSPERGFSVIDIREPIFYVEAREDHNELPHIEHPIEDPKRYTDHPRCDNCGMDRNRWARTRYEFETSKGRFYTCSIHCVVVLAFFKLKEVPQDVKVAEYLRPERMLDAERAVFLIGSSMPGTMSPVSKIAFSSKEEALRFAMKYGGRIADFKTALSEAKKEIESR